jgi:hydrogenase maturation protease
MVRICLMGVGNVLTGDDALGPWVLKSLEAKYQLGDEVTVFDAGTPGLDLTLFLDGFDAIIAIDAIKLDAPAGTVKSYRRDALLGHGVPIKMSPHEPTLREALLRLKLLGRLPAEVFLVGAVPQSVATGTGLSPEVQAAIPEVEAQVVQELQRLGANPARRQQPLAPELWWEASVPFLQPTHG